MRKNGNKKWIAVLQAAGIGLLAFLCSYNDLFYTLDTMVKDMFCQQPRSINQTIKIIAIDEKTLTALGPIGTWSRENYADLLNTCGDYPSVIGFDIMFMGNVDSTGDQAFEEAVKAHENVVVSNHLLFDTQFTVADGKMTDVNGLYVAGVEYPYLGEEVSQGFVNISSDADGVVRSLVPYFQRDEDSFSVFSYAVYDKYCEQTGAAKPEIKLDANGKQWIYYAGKPYEYEAVSFIDVLEGRIDPRVFTDAIVLVGAYTPGLQDQFSVPNSSNQMYGVEIHANIIQSLMDGKFPVPVNRLLAAAFALGCAVLFYFIFRKLHIRFGTVVFVLTEAALVFVDILLYTKANCMLPVIYAEIFVFVSYLTALVIGFIQERVEKKKISGAFRKYVAPQVVDEIMKSGQYHIQLGGENRDIAVLFVDIRGFTPLSESLQPEQVVEILNEYLNLTTNAIFANNGTLDKFIGDATMAVFNAPFDLEDYEFKAVCAAWDICNGAKALEDTCKERFGKSVAFGVGVNCGPAVVGNIGCDFRMDYTAIGDTVNTAARLEANAKRGQVLISQAVYDKVQDRVEAEPIGEIPLKGKSQGVFVYSLTEVRR